MICSKGAPVRRRAHPPPRLDGQERMHVEPLPVFQHEIDRSAELVRQDGERLAFAVFAHQLVVELPARFVAFEEQLRSQGKGPAEMGVADLFAAAAVFLAIGFLGAGDQAAIGGEILNPGKAADVLNLIEQIEGIDPAHAGDALQEGISSRVMLLCVGNDVLFEDGQDPVIGVNHVEIGGHGHAHRGIVEPIQQAFPVLRFGDPSQRHLQVVLAGGILGVGEEFGPLAHQMVASTHQVPSGTHPLGVDVGHGNEAAPEQGSDLLGVDLVVLALAAMDGPHIQSVPEDKGDVLFGTEVGQPVPGEHAFRADHQIVPIGGDGFEEGFRLGLDVAMEQDVSFLAEDAQVHFVGVQVDSTVMLVLLGVQSHEKASLLRVADTPIIAE